MTPDPEAGDTNVVELAGHLPAPADQRTLPSGDVLTTFRLVVRRPSGGRGTIDSVECVTTNGRVARTALRLAAGDRVEVRGSLRRRFWRGPGGVQSRYAVEVTSLRRVKP